MAVTPTTLRARFPEVSDVTAYPDVYVQGKIDDAALTVSSTWGKWQDIAQSYLTMHYIFVAKQTEGGLQSAAGAMAHNTQETVGAVSHSLGMGAINPTNADSIFLSNVYGQEFIRLRKMAFPFVAMVV